MSQVTQEIESKQFTVPWTGFDVFLFLAIWLAPLVVSFGIVAQNQPKDAADHGHPIAQLIEQSKRSPVVFLIAFLAVVVVAPIIEEFLFRMLFQGWLEAKLKQCQIPCKSGISIVIVSICFSVIHMNNYGPIDVSAMLHGLIATMIFSLMVFSAGIIYLTRVRNVRIADYLVVPERLFRPRFFVYVGYCLLVIVLCLALNAALANTFSDTNVAPISIFFFSLALGVLYCRTRNLADCVLLHASLNGIGLALVWGTSGGA